MKKIIWLLLDDRRGSVGQAMGIANALGNRMEIIEKKIVYTGLAGLPNWIRGKTLLGVNLKASDDLKDNYPDVVMSISRRTVPVARYIRKMSANKTKIVQLMYPDGGIGLKEMDLVIVPDHDSPSKKQIANAMIILGAPTKICPKVLQQAKEKWLPEFANLPKPYTTVIIGGGIKGKEWPLANAEKLADKIKELHDKTGGSILITTSRRTGEKAQNLIMQKLKDIPAYTYIWGENKENPLMGFYACADRIIVTADSVSMCSEACGTGVPVLLFRDKNWLPQKHQNFAKVLIDNGYAEDLCNEDAIAFTPKATLNSAADIADKIIAISQN